MLQLTFNHRLKPAFEHPGPVLLFKFAYNYPHDYVSAYAKWLWR